MPSTWHGGTQERSSGRRVSFSRTVALPPNLPAAWPVQVSYSYASNGRLEVKAHVKGQPADSLTTFQRENSMLDEEMEIWTKYVTERMARD